MYVCMYVCTANAFLDDFEVQKTYLKWLQKHQKRRKINKAKVLPEKTDPKQPLRKIIERDLEKFLKINNQTRPRKTPTGVFPRSMVSFKLQ